MDANDQLELERLKHKIEVLNERVESCKLQAGHAEATVVSERRQWDRLAADYKELKKEVGEICEDIKRFDKILFNSGQGMIRDVDRLKLWKEGVEKSEEKKVPFWLQVITILLAVAAIVIPLIKHL